MDFFDALSFVAATSVIGRGTEGPVWALSGVERVVELVIEGVEIPGS